jgi:hypothetical protein
VATDGFKNGTSRPAPSACRFLQQNPPEAVIREKSVFGSRVLMRIVAGEDRGQGTLFPERLDDYLAEDNPVGNKFKAVSRSAGQSDLASVSRRRL